MMLADRQPVGGGRADGDVERERRAVRHGPHAVGALGVAGLVEQRVGAVDVAAWSSRSRPRRSRCATASYAPDRPVQSAGWV